MRKSFIILLTVLLAASMLLAGCSPATPAPEASQAPSTSAPASSAPAAEPTGTDSNGTDLCKLSADALGKKFRIGIIPMSMNDTFQVMFVNAAKMLLEGLGHEAVIQGSTAHIDAEVQVQLIENMIAGGIDAILVAPSATDGLLTAIRKCQEAGVVLINMDAKFNDELLQSNGLEPVPYAGTDNFEAGRKAGAFVKENFEKGVKTAILLGVEGQDARIARREGFLEGAGDTVEIVSEQTANWDVEQGYQAAQNIITANPDLQVIYAQSDGMAVGAARAIEEAKLLDQIKVIGFDAIPEALQLVEEGKILADVAQYAPKIGEVSAELALKALNGEDVPLKTDTGSNVLVKEDVPAFNEYVKRYQ